MVHRGGPGGDLLQDLPQPRVRAVLAIRDRHVAGLGDRVDRLRGAAAPHEVQVVGAQGCAELRVRLAVLGGDGDGVAASCVRQAVEPYVDPRVLRLVDQREEQCAVWR